MFHLLKCRKTILVIIEASLLLYLCKVIYNAVYPGICNNALWNQWKPKSTHWEFTDSQYIKEEEEEALKRTERNARSSILVDASSWNLLDKWKAMNKKEKLEYKINYTVGLNIDAQIGDFGDYNSDVKTDLILYKYDEKKEISTIYVYVFNVAQGKFKYHTETALEGKVQNIMATDWNFDGILDILILFTHSNGKKNDYYLCAFVQNDQEQLVETWNSRKMEQEKQKIALQGQRNYYYSNIHPLIVDINNDGLPDLIGQQNNGSSFERFAWINQKGEFKSEAWDNLDMFQLEDVSGDSLNEEENQIAEISNPNSSAIVDLNGDCKADLVFTVYNKKDRNPNTLFLEIWINTMIDGKGIFRKMKKNYQLPPNALQILFADFNADGSMDLIVPTCTKSKSCDNCCVSDDKIYYIPNIQKKICDKTWKQIDENICRPAYNLCSESEFELLKDVDDKYVSILDENNKLHLTGNDSYPQYISIGDIDNDGYADILVTLRNEKENKYVRIYKNEFKMYHTEKNNLEIRHFFNFYQFITSPSNETIIDVYNSAFFDIYENGMLDILIFGKYINDKKNENKFSAVAFVRNTETDSLFLKTTSLNGICVTDCYQKNQLNKKPFGTNAHGPTFKITVIDKNGVKTSRIGVQKSQSSHFPLQLSYVIFGLGRTSNYVEEFYLGMPTHQTKYFSMWVSIIPNSHIIVIPYPLNDSNKWKIQLSVNPSKKIYSIIYITLICLIIIGLLIFILDRKEKSEDMKEEKGFKSHFVIG